MTADPHEHSSRIVEVPVPQRGVHELATTEQFLAVSDGHPMGAWPVSQRLGRLLGAST